MIPAPTGASRSSHDSTTRRRHTMPKADADTCPTIAPDEAGGRADAAGAAQPQVRLADYRPPPLLVGGVDLHFQLDAQATRVRAQLALRHGDGRSGPARLDGMGLALRWIAVDGVPLEAGDFTIDESGISIGNTPASFTLESEVEISPAANAALVGLYASGGDLLCTQCEAEGFRRITWFPDRPDVLATYRVRLEADLARYPYLLSNGHLVEAGTCAAGRHYAVWEDPFPKPCYLFALVAGDFDVVERRVLRMTGRPATLRLFVARGEAPRASYAMDALERALRWDERAFGRELDLDLFMLVAVRDFNFGAMENKGLNIFSTMCILATPDTAADEDYERIERLIAHEYFHNWSGNRVTCRDWFQLCLKEGLTVFREQEFCLEHRGTAARIRQVRVLRSRQFTEDAGTLAHPVRPGSFRKIDNFYTSTVYEKGAELVRLLGTLLGRDAARRGIIDYFGRFDGRAATVEDFLGCFPLSARALGQMMTWYTQAGTPALSISARYEQADGTLALSFSQAIRPTPGQPTGQPLLIPIQIALLDEEGREQGFRHGEREGERFSTTFTLERERDSLTIRGVARPPVLSLMRGFSAPVRACLDEPPDHVFVRLAADADPFNRWEAAQALATRFILQRLGGAADERGEERLAHALDAAVHQDDLSEAVRAALLGPPAESELSLSIEPVDPAALHAAREGYLQALSQRLYRSCLAVYERYGSDRPYSPATDAAGPRALRNAALQLLALSRSEEALARARDHYRDADNLTDRLAALQAIARCDESALQQALDHFHAQWRHEPLAIDKWFAIQARMASPGDLGRITALGRHRDFDRRNPDRLRALVETFALENPTGFHSPDGNGYVFVAEQILAVDQFNPITAARLIDCFADWRRYVRPRAERMRGQLQRIVATRGISANVAERASTAVAADLP
jgi:aminopeptidase N